MGGGRRSTLLFLACVPRRHICRKSGWEEGGYTAGGLDISVSAAHLHICTSGRLLELNVCALEAPAFWQGPHLSLKASRTADISC